MLIYKLVQYTSVLIKTHIPNGKHFRANSVCL